MMRQTGGADMLVSGFLATWFRFCQLLGVGLWAPLRQTLFAVENGALEWQFFFLILFNSIPTITKKPEYINTYLLG